MYLFGFQGSSNKDSKWDGKYSQQDYFLSPMPYSEQLIILVQKGMSYKDRQTG
jgi:hypothetical protein